MRIKIVKKSIEYRTIEGMDICLEREKLSLSQLEFAQRCGHTQQYQSQLESPGTHKITAEKAQQILSVLENTSKPLV